VADIEYRESPPAKCDVPVTDNTARAEPLYIAARTVLLDALEALAAHASSLVVVGAQAVYVRTGTAGLATAPFTTDGDVAVDPSSLTDDPALEDAMGDAAFELKTNHLDARVAGSAALLVAKMTALVSNGEASQRKYVVIHDGRFKTVCALRGSLPVDRQSCAARFATGQGALGDDEVDRDVVALPVEPRRAHPGPRLDPTGLHKIADRVGVGKLHRINDKDASDVLRLVRATPVAQMADSLDRLRGDDMAGETTTEALRTSALCSAHRPPRVSSWPFGHCGSTCRPISSRRNSSATSAS